MQITEVLGSLSYVLAQVESTSPLSYLQEKFTQGGLFMWPILIVLIIGLAISFVKIWSLTRSSTNSKKFIIAVKEKLKNGGVQEAMKYCENSSGAIASVFHAGLLRADEGVEAAEKAITTYGAIEMNFLERGLVWISLFISVAPMIGFLGTVQGMVVAFDDIAAANTMSPSIVANGISIALLTTLFGLIVAIILQFFYNFFLSRIDAIVGDMEESSIELIDALYQMKK
ncbi:MAG: MotA/TolQ/ExbB proton channel family protein [Ignavibacteriae bacterium]|nr:MotA/TolQ/ExbB proton channel family protein [Ignavibacteriota bacterium]MCB0748191.1 MotA/TolQ/ExbB proton channel family protein [Ignavibacteriota bacterium]MCB0751384.1 MotA/TolQ/ExbB proton channel family protein [Ignavibacteriota bacterium]MCB9250075.1 MotA/TolQ/ExbB proton channel family protein [Ignavibacteriales bacterium]